MISWVHKIPPKPIVTVEGAESGFECAEFTFDRLPKPHKPHQKKGKWGFFYSVRTKPKGSNAAASAHLSAPSPKHPPLRAKR